MQTRLNDAKAAPGVHDAITLAGAAMNLWNRRRIAARRVQPAAA